MTRDRLPRKQSLAIAALLCVSVVVGLEARADATVHRTLVINTGLHNMPPACFQFVVDSAVFTGVESVYQFYRQQSFEQFQLQGRVVGPYALSAAASSSCIPGVWQTEANAHAITDPGVIADGGLGAYDSITYVFPAPPCTPQIAHDDHSSDNINFVFIDCSTSTVTLEHQISKLLADNIGLGNSWRSGTSSEGDLSTTIGGPACCGLREFVAPHKVQMGWIPSGPPPAADRVKEVSVTGLYGLSPLEWNVSGTNQVLKIDGIAAYPYFISYRSPYSAWWIDNLPDAFTQKMSVHQFNAATSETYFVGSNTENTAAFGDGETWTAPDHQVCVTMVNHTDSRANVFVSIGCTSHPPDPCPNVTPCLGANCLKTNELLDQDTGMATCVLTSGGTINCRTNTVHVITNRCDPASCCFSHTCVCGSCNPQGQYLECRPGPLPE